MPHISRRALIQEASVPIGRRLRSFGSGFIGPITGGFLSSPDEEAAPFASEIGGISGQIGTALLLPLVAKMLADRLAPSFGGLLRKEFSRTKTFPLPRGSGSTTDGAIRFRVGR